MHMIQYSHGVLVESGNVSKEVTKPLPSFNPPIDQMPANPFSKVKGAAQKAMASAQPATPAPQPPAEAPAIPVQETPSIVPPVMATPVAADPFATPV